MTLKWLALGTLSCLTVTACANSNAVPRTAGTAFRVQSSAKISGGASDDVGQYILSDRPSFVGLTLEASAAPSQR